MKKVYKVNDTLNNKSQYLDKRKQVTKDWDMLLAIKFKRCRIIYKIRKPTCSNCCDQIILKVYKIR